MLHVVLEHRVTLLQVALMLGPIFVGLVYLLSATALPQSALFEAAEGEPFARLAALLYLTSGLMLLIGMCTRVAWVSALGNYIASSMWLTYSYAVVSTRPDAAWVAASATVLLGLVYLVLAIGDTLGQTHEGRGV